MQLLMVRYDEKTAAEAALARLEEAVRDKVVDVDDVALVYKTPDGKVHLHQTKDASARRGAGKGAILGAVLGVFTGGIGALAVAGAAGGAAVTARDRGIPNRVMERLGSAIEGSEAVVFISAETDVVEQIMARLDGQVNLDYMVLSPDEAAELRAALG